MMFKQTSSAVSASVSRMFCALAVMFRCVSGTSFGRDVVPDVWRSSATSSGVRMGSARKWGRESFFDSRVTVREK